MKMLAAITIFRRKISVKWNFKPLKPYIIQEIFFKKILLTVVNRDCAKIFFLD